MNDRLNDRFKAETTSTLRAEPDLRQRYRVKPHGWIERIELRPRVDLANMDARRHYELIVELIDPDGVKVPLEVFVVARDVRSP